MRHLKARSPIPVTRALLSGSVLLSSVLLSACTGSVESADGQGPKLGAMRDSAAPGTSPQASVEAVTGQAGASGNGADSDVLSATSGVSGTAGGASLPSRDPVASDGAEPGPSASLSPSSGQPSVEQVAADEAAAEQDPELFAVAEQYFPGVGAASKKQLFRLTRTQLELTTQSLIPGLYSTPLSATMPADPLQTNYEYADNLSVNPANFAPYTDWAHDLAARAEQAPQQVIACAETDLPCLEQRAREFVERAFRHVPTAPQIERFVAFFISSVNEVGLAEAVGDLVDVTLTSPHYLFRDEALTDGNGLLLGAQRLQHLTYTLADVPPVALGFSPGEEDSVFANEAATKSAADTILKSPQAREKLLRFFVAWLEIKAPDEFTIAPQAFPEFTPEVARALVADTEQFLRRALETAAPSLKAITQSSDAFVSDAVAFLYDQDSDPSSGSAGSFLALNPAQRIGAFSQPAFIASHSGPDTTRLVKRGVFFARKAMCIPLGMPPAGVVTTIANLDGVTERERVETATASSECQACHSVINPFGFMLESYDPIGRFRTEDDAGLTIDPSIAVDFLEEGALRAVSAPEALLGLTQSYRFQQCFTRQLFRFYLGRGESADDDPVLRQMFFTFAQNDAQDVVGMLERMATSAPLAARLETP